MPLFITPTSEVHAVGVMQFSDVKKDESYDLSGQIDVNLKQKVAVKRRFPRISQTRVRSKFSCNSETVPGISAQSSGEFIQKPNDFIEAIQSLETGRKMHSCKFCGLQRENKAQVASHVLHRHLSNVPMVKCTICSHQSKMKGDMKRHYMSKHSLPEALAKSAVS